MSKGLSCLAKTRCPMSQMRAVKSGKRGRKQRKKQIDLERQKEARGREGD